MRKIGVLAVLALSGLCGLLRGDGPMGHMGHGSGQREFKVVAIDYLGTKIWVPGTLIVRLGEEVKITLINNIKQDPATHGFAIDEFGIKTVVARGAPQAVTFKADKEGLFNIYCQLHPAHIGGQLLVIK